MLGPKIFEPVVEGIRSKLRSAKRNPDPQPRRMTPRYLRVGACPDDQQEVRLRAERLGDVTTLKWDAVMNCFGQATDLARANIVTVL